jgi:hypothetical protein
MGKINLILKLRSGDTLSAFNYFVNYLREKYDFITIETVEQMSFFDDKKINVIFIPYGFGQLSNITEKAKFIQRHPEAKIIRFFNEYNLSESSDFQKIFKTRPIDLLITNYEFEKIKRYYKKRIVINVNCLSYYDFNCSFVDEKKYNVIYYGTFRIFRIPYFQKYFTNNPNIILSFHKKHISKLKKLCGNNLKIISKIRLGVKNSELRLFKYSLYIEDPFTHKCYNFPANRFYEALSYDTVLLFDKNCINTFNRYGIDISDFIVDNKEDLANKIKTLNYSEALQKQKKWLENVKNDFIELEKQVKEHIEPLLI